VEYPHGTEQRVKVMLRALGRKDALIQKKLKKSPVKIADLSALTTLLHARNPEDKAMADPSIVTFWGMARLAELKSAKISGPLSPKTGVTPQDAIGLERCTVIKPHNAKTAKPGEIQRLKLVQVRRSGLAPVQVVERRIAQTKRASDSLFGFETPQGRHHLTKRRVNEILMAAWHGKELGREGLS